MSYESAPATSMIAINCACCGKELLDAVSVETGMGPYCRKKHGFGDAQEPADWAKVAELALDGAWPSDAHDWANALVHRIACEQTGSIVPKYLAVLDAIGYKKLARRIAERVGAVQVEEENGSLIVKARYSEDFNAAARRVPGARWDRVRKVRVVPLSSRVQLWQAIRSAFGEGTVILGSKGLSVLEAA